PVLWIPSQRNTRCQQPNYNKSPRDPSATERKSENRSSRRKSITIRTGSKHTLPIPSVLDESEKTLPLIPHTFAIYPLPLGEGGATALRLARRVRVPTFETVDSR